MIIFKRYEVLDVLHPHMPSNPLIVEAGAFLGHDTIKMATKWPQGMVHAFEPVPIIFDELTVRTKSYHNIAAHQYALSNLMGQSTLYVAHKPAREFPTQASSLHAPHRRTEWSSIQFPYTIQVPTITLSDWAHNNNIQSIDLLWLDLQGHELSVLQAAGDILSRIRLIHTEVYFDHAYHNQPLYKDIVDWLGKVGFQAIAQDFENTHDWHFGNVIFMKMM